MDDVEIDRALRAALSAEPSPEFTARVRTAIAEAPQPSVVLGWLKPAAVIFSIAVVAIVMGLRREQAEVAVGLAPSISSLSSTTYAPSTRHAVLRLPSTVPTVKSAKLPVRPPRAHAAVPAEPALPEVIVAANDVEALRQLLVSLNEHTFVASFDETPVSTPWAMTSLSVVPIGGDPLDSPPAHKN
jgi:hypothetical protein